MPLVGVVLGGAERVGVEAEVVGDQVQAGCRQAVPAGRVRWIPTAVRTCTSPPEETRRYARLVPSMPPSGTRLSMQVTPARPLAVVMASERSTIIRSENYAARMTG